MDLKILYEELLKIHGKLEKWWPGSAEEIIISAVLTQNTNWKNVERAMENLKSKCENLETKNFLECVYMLREDLPSLIKPAGFYNIKSQRLVALLSWMKQYEFSTEKISEKSTYDLREELLSVKGIGKETADSILLYAFEKPVFVVDAYTKKLLKRLYNTEFKDYDDYRLAFENSIEQDVRIYQEYHGLIVEHSKKYCNSKPKCNSCGLNNSCFQAKYLQNL